MKLTFAPADEVNNALLLTHVFHCVVLYETKHRKYFVITCSLPSENGFRVPEDRVFRRMFGPRAGDLRVMWRKMRSEEPKSLYLSRSVTRAIKSDLTEF